MGWWLGITDVSSQESKSVYPNYPLMANCACFSLQTMSEQTITTVNIGHLGNEAEVQLAEALVAVSEAVVAAAAEVDDNPRVVTVEETAHSSAEDAVLQQVGSLSAFKLPSIRHLKN